MQNVSTVPGAQSLQQVHPVVSYSTSGELSPADTFDSVASARSSLASDSDNTQIEAPQQTQNPIHSDHTKDKRNVIIPQDVMQKFLQTIGSDHYDALDEYDPGLEHTSEGYRYHPQLLSSEQTKSLHGFIIQMETQPNILQKMLKRMKAVTSTN